MVPAFRQGAAFGRVVGMPPERIRSLWTGEFCFSAFGEFSLSNNSFRLACPKLSELATSASRLSAQGVTVLPSRPSAWSSWRKPAPPDQKRWDAPDEPWDRSKPVGPRRAIVREVSVLRTEAHYGLCLTSDERVGFPAQSVSAEQIRSLLYPRCACGHSFGRFGRHGAACGRSSNTTSMRVTRRGSRQLRTGARQF